MAMRRATPLPLYPEDKRQVASLLAGDERAFRRFFDENYPRLYRFVLARLAGSAADTEEVVQNTLSKALKGLHTYRAESQLFTWLCAIARSEIADWKRRQGRYHERVVLTEDSAEARAAVDSFRASDLEDPEQSLQRTERARLIQVALDRLPPTYGDALEWKYIEGCSTREIADRLDVHVEAAQSVLARAKRAFREVYESLAASVGESAARG